MAHLIHKTVLLPSSPSSLGFLSLPFKVRPCKDPKITLLLSERSKKSRLLLWFLRAVPWTLNEVCISVCLGGVNQTYAVEEIRKCFIKWCAGAGMLWNILSREFNNNSFYNNESNKSVCATAGYESWVLQMMISCLAAKNLLDDSRVLQLLLRLERPLYAGNFGTVSQVPCR